MSAPSTSADAPDAAAAHPQAGAFSPGYRAYFIGILALTFFFNHMDRTLLAALVEPIKADLHLKDGQIGLLAGLAFSIFYVTAGLPLAKLADRHNRVRIIAIALAAWSCFTGACGLAGSFVQLLLARVGVAVGEAAGQPPAYAIIGDLYSSARRSTATAIYQVGGPVGAATGLALGGLLAQHIGWRGVFFVMTLPGLLLAAVLWLTLREPPRGLSEGRQAQGEAPSVLAVARLLLSRPTFVCMALGAALTTFSIFSLTVWTPSFLVRSHGLSLSQAGALAGSIELVAGLVGAVGGAMLADRLGRRDPRWWMLAPGFAGLIAAPILLAFLFSGSLALAMGLAVCSATLTRIWMGPTYAAVQTLVGLRMRTVASALLLFTINMVGMGLGPLVVGWLSDLMAAGSGASSLRNGLVAAVPALILGGGLFLLAARSLKADVARAPD